MGKFSFNWLGRWGMSSLNGLLMIIFGFIALVFPNATIDVLAIYFALSILIGGIVLGIYSIQYRKYTPNWKLKLVEGSVSVILGIIIILYSKFAVEFLMVIVGAWAIVIGVVFIISYFAKKHLGLVDILNLITGVISLALGAIIIFNPFQSFRFIVILIGIYTIIYGVFSMVYSAKTVNRTTIWLHTDEDKDNSSSSAE